MFLDEFTMAVVWVIAIAAIVFSWVTIITATNTDTDNANKCYAYSQKTHVEYHYWDERDACVQYVYPR